MTKNESSSIAFDLPKAEITKNESSFITFDLPEVTMTKNEPSSENPSRAPEMENTVETVKRSTKKTQNNSKNGCSACKERRINCNEEQPHCSNCSRHSVLTLLNAPDPTPHPGLVNLPSQIWPPNQLQTQQIQLRQPGGGTQAQHQNQQIAPSYIEQGTETQFPTQQLSPSQIEQATQNQLQNGQVSSSQARPATQAQVQDRQLEFSQIDQGTQTQFPNQQISSSQAEQTPQTRVHNRQVSSSQARLARQAQLQNEQAAPAQVRPATQPQLRGRQATPSQARPRTHFQFEVRRGPPSQDQATQTQRWGRQSMSVTDLEILHYYNVSTSYTLSHVPELRTFYRLHVPPIGFDYPFLLHGILALAALHLSHELDGPQKFLFLNEAHCHYTAALQEASGLMSNITPTNCPALYLFTVFCYHIAIALGPRPGDLLLVGEGGLAEWLVLFKGMKSTVDSYDERLRNSYLQPMFAIQQYDIDRISERSTRLGSLHRLFMDNYPDSPDRQVYIAAVRSLSRSFPPPKTSPHYVPYVSPQMVFAWLYSIDDAFVDKLKRKEDGALVILAHFCVLLSGLAHLWWTSRWVNHLMGEIYAGVSPERRIWLTWPMEELGWFPN